MPWQVEYYEQEDTRQPAEDFEDALKRAHQKLAAKLVRILLELEHRGPQLGGGLIERCRGYEGLWEARAIFNKRLAREFFGFDGSRVILLHGYDKETGEEASTPDMVKAHQYWHDYQRARRISPEQEEPNE